MATDSQFLGIDSSGGILFHHKIDSSCLKILDEKSEMF
jgi:hypothetical protein